MVTPWYRLTLEVSGQREKGHPFLPGGGTLKSPPTNAAALSMTGTCELL